jgi:hypothetical protein
LPIFRFSSHWFSTASGSGICLWHHACNTELFVGTVTAYTSRPNAVTASGALPFDGLLACPRKYPLGTLFKIGGKLYECRDRLSRKYEDRFDIWKPTAIAARLFGKRRFLILAVIPAKKPTLIASGLNVRLARY